MYLSEAILNQRKPLDWNKTVTNSQYLEGLVCLADDSGVYLERPLVRERLQRGGHLLRHDGLLSREVDGALLDDELGRLPVKVIQVRHLSQDDRLLWTEITHM